MTKDEKLLQIAKNLAEALIDYAYTRKDEDKKKVMELHTELCRVYKDAT